MESVCLSNSGNLDLGYVTNHWVPFIDLWLAHPNSLEIKVQIYQGF